MSVATVCEWCRQPANERHIHQGLWWPVVDTAAGDREGSMSEEMRRPLSEFYAALRPKGKLFAVVPLSDQMSEWVEITKADLMRQLKATFASNQECRWRVEPDGVYWIGVVE